MAGKTRQSRARLVIEMVGPTSEALVESVAELCEIARAACRRGVQTSYPEPCTIETVVRQRKAKTKKEGE